MPRTPAALASPVFAPDDTLSVTRARDLERKEAAAAAAASVPVKQTVVFNLEQIPPSLAQDLSVDRIHQILRSAEAGETGEYFALCRDMIFGTVEVQNAWSQRKMKLLSKDGSKTVRSEDSGDPKAKRNDEFIRDQIRGCCGWLQAMTHLLDGALYPVAVVEKVFERSSLPGVHWQLCRLVPVPHHLLEMRDGILRIKETDDAGRLTGKALDPDPVRYIVHRGHLLQSFPDCWGGPIRAAVFWFFFAALTRGMWVRRLERHQAPFIIGKYDAANPSDRAALLSAIKGSASRFGIVVSRETDIAVHTSLAGGDDTEAFESFIDYCYRQIEKLFAGQTMTSEAQASGLGSNQADVHEGVLTDMAAFDAIMLAGTLHEQLFEPLMQLNALDGPVPEISWPVTTENLQSRALLLKTLKEAGLSPSPAAAPQLTETFGMPLTMAQAAPEPAPPNDPGLAAVAALAALRGLQSPTGALDTLARGAAADLALAFRGNLAPVRLAIRESTGPADLERRLTALYADWTPAASPVSLRRP